MGVAYLFALLTGFVFAGFVSSIWALVSGRDVSFSLLVQTSFLAPFEVLVVVFSVPLLLMKLGVKHLAIGESMSFAWGFIGASVLCGFFQGVIVMSSIHFLG